MKNFVITPLDSGLFVLRMFAVARLIYGVWDNIIDPYKMQEFAGFLQQFSFPVPLFSAYLSVWIQFIGGLLLLIGWHTRWAALILVFNFLIAVTMVHIPAGDTVEATTPALALLAITACLYFTGAGKLSLDHRIFQRSKRL